MNLEWLYPITRFNYIQQGLIPTLGLITLIKVVKISIWALLVLK